MEKRDEDAFAVCRYSFGQGLNLFPNSMRGEEDGLLFYITRIFKTNFGSPGKVCVLDNKFYLCRTRTIKVCQHKNKQYC